MRLAAFSEQAGLTHPTRPLMLSGVGGIAHLGDMYMNSLIPFNFPWNI